MRKHISIFLISFFLTSLVACKTADNDSTPAPTPVEPPIDVVTPTVPIKTSVNEIDSALAVETLKILSSDEYQGRKYGTEGYGKAITYILDYFQEFNLKQLDGSYTKKFSSVISGQTVESTNIVGYVEGTEKPDVFLAIGAHFDHVGIHNGSIYNGADDNASGVGGLLTLAKYFSEHPPKHSILFMAFDAEEAGLQGSRDLVNQSVIPVQKIAFMLNMDMISRNTKKEIYASGTYHYPFLKDPTSEVAKDYSPISVFFGHDRPGTGSNDWTHQSDHSAFHTAKIPYIYFGVEDHPHYHKPTDDYATINVKFYTDVVDFLCGLVLKFDADWETIKG